MLGGRASQADNHYSVQDQELLGGGGGGCSTTLAVGHTWGVLHSPFQMLPVISFYIATKPDHTFIRDIYLPVVVNEGRLAFTGCGWQLCKVTESYITRGQVT